MLEMTIKRAMSYDFMEKLRLLVLYDNRALWEVVHTIDKKLLPNFQEIAFRNCALALLRNPVIQPCITVEDFECGPSGEGLELMLKKFGIPNVISGLLVRDDMTGMQKWLVLMDIRDIIRTHH